VRRLCGAVNLNPVPVGIANKVSHKVREISCISSLNLAMKLAGTRTHLRRTSVTGRALQAV
jgi:hypothetical protein